MCPTSHERDVSDSAWLTPERRTFWQTLKAGFWRAQAEALLDHARVADDVIQELTTALRELNRLGFLMHVENDDEEETAAKAAVGKAIDRVDQLGKQDT